MAIGSGLSAQLMMKAESTYGTAVTPDRAFEFSSESITADFGKAVSRALGRGRVDRTDRRKTYIRGHGGDINFDVTNKNFGLIFQHMLGQNTVTGAGANKTHTCVLDSLAQQGKFATVQIGRPDVGGTVRAFTYEGGKITGWELSCDLDDILKLKTTWDFEAVLTATALATPSWVATQELFIFNEAAVTVGGTTVYAKNFSLTGDSKLATDRRFLGGTKKEPLAGDFTDLMGTLGCEFEDLTHWASAIAGTQQAVVITFTLATVIPTTAVAYSLVITLPKCEFEEVKPVVGGPGIVPLELPFRVLDDGTNAPMTMVYTTSDTAA
jgi:hypothetical protein